MLSGICAGRLLTPEMLAKICVSPGVAAVKRACVIWFPLLLLRVESVVLILTTLELSAEKLKDPTVFVISAPLLNALAWNSR